MQILQNALSFSNIAPDEMAFRIMTTLSYTAITAEGVIHLIKYVPVECQIRQLNLWLNYQWNINNTRTSLISSHQDQVLPIMFKIYGSWFRSMPRLVEIPTPNIHRFRPRSPFWKYVNPRHERNLFERRSRLPPELYHVPHRKTLHA